MVENSLYGSGEGFGRATGRCYSTCTLFPSTGSPAVFSFTLVSFSTILTQRYLWEL